ncbi:MAG: MarR family winged helix-turn-helix transcriptional regulator [Labedaea sp.]
MTASGPRWLTPDEQRAWRALVRVLLKLPTALDSQLQRDAQLSHFEFGVLAALSEAPARTLRMSELAGLTSSSLSRLSHVVKRLEKRDWVRRAPCLEDGRFINATLTDHGFAKVAEVAPGHVRIVRALIIDALTPDQLEQLAEIGSRIIDRIDGG